MYFVERKTAKEVAEKFGYKHRGFTTIVSEFNKKLKNGSGDDLFFTSAQRGRRKTKEVSQANDIVIELRKKYHSVEEIKAILDGKGLKISEKTIYNKTGRIFAAAKKNKIGKAKSGVTQNTSRQKL